jgi:hypothetical protein
MEGDGDDHDDDNNNNHRDAENIVAISVKNVITQSSCAFVTSVLHLMLLPLTLWSIKSTKYSS